MSVLFISKSLKDILHKKVGSGSTSSVNNCFNAAKESTSGKLPLTFTFFSTWQKEFEYLVLVFVCLFLSLVNL